MVSVCGSTTTTTRLRNTICIIIVSNSSKDVLAYNKYVYIYSINNNSIKLKIYIGKGSHNINRTTRKWLEHNYLKYMENYSKEDFFQRGLDLACT